MIEQFKEDQHIVLTTRMMGCTGNLPAGTEGRVIKVSKSGRTAFVQFHDVGRTRGWVLRREAKEVVHEQV